MTTLKIKDSVWASKETVIPIDVDAVTTKALHHYAYSDLLFVLRLVELIQDTAEGKTKLAPTDLGKSITAAVNTMWADATFCYHELSSNYYKPNCHFLLDKLAVIWACAKLKMPYCIANSCYDVLELLSADLISTLVYMLKAGTLNEVTATDGNSMNNLKVKLFNTVNSQYEAGTTWNETFRLDLLEFIITALANELTSRDLASN